MSYAPFRDNPDLDGLPDDTYDRLVPLGDLIEASHLDGYHASECGCVLPTCWTRQHHGYPSTEEVLGWLVAKSLLDLDDPFLKGLFAALPATDHTKEDGTDA